MVVNERPAEAIREYAQTRHKAVGRAEALLNRVASRVRQAF
jgi:hypothetical protein